MVRVQDALITLFLEEIEWSIFPIINADGYVYSWTNERLWRKNRCRPLLTTAHAQPHTHTHQNAND